MHMRHIVICGLPGSTIFFHIISKNGMVLGKSYWTVNTGRFIMFSVITNIYNKKTKGPTLMELFTATGKLKKFFFFLQLEMFDVCTMGNTAHIDTILQPGIQLGTLWIWVLVGSRDRADVVERTRISGPSQNIEARFVGHLTCVPFIILLSAFPNLFYRAWPVSI